MALPSSINGENPYFKILELPTGLLSSIIIACHRGKGISLWSYCDKIVLKEKIDLLQEEGRKKLRARCLDLVAN